VLRHDIEAVAVPSTNYSRSVLKWIACPAPFSIRGSDLCQMTTNSALNMALRECFRMRLSLHLNESSKGTNFRGVF
jgi:hypothetical protein